MNQLSEPLLPVIPMIAIAALLAAFGLAPEAVIFIAAPFGLVAAFAWEFRREQVKGMHRPIIAAALVALIGVAVQLAPDHSGAFTLALGVMMVLMIGLGVELGVRWLQRKAG